MGNSPSLAWLILNQGDPEELSFELEKFETVLGRGSDCDIQVDDPLVSRRHATIRFREGRFEITDLNSSNGTYLNGNLVRSTRIHDGDLLRIGNSALVMQITANRNDTIIQSKPVLDTFGLETENRPYGINNITCHNCGADNFSNGQFCVQCGAALSSLPENFLHTQKLYQKYKVAYQQRGITQEEYQAVLSDLIVQDNLGEYWMMGLDSGEWYWYDGEDWQKREPMRVISRGDETQQTDAEVQQEVRELAAPSKLIHSSRWRVIILWLISALIVLILGIFTVVEYRSFLRTGPIRPLPLKRDGEEISSGQDPEEHGEELIPATEPPASSDTDFVSDELFRSYDPERDNSLFSLTAGGEFVEDQSTDEYFFYQNQFDSGPAGILIMGWCAIDRITLDENLSGMHLEGELDGTSIPEQIWTKEYSQEDDMVCLRSRVVVENLNPGTYHYIWSTTYNKTIFDGWETYPQGRYITEYSITIPDGYTYDASDGVVDYWGELDSEEARIWVSEGELNIALEHELISAISHYQDRQFKNFIFSTTAQSRIDTIGMFGIVFRYESDDYYYSFQIVEDGLYRLIRQSGETIELIPWTESGAIRGQGLGNKLSVSMNGEQIQAFINDQLVAEVSDGTFTSGELSLIAGTPRGVQSFHAVFKEMSIEAFD